MTALSAAWPEDGNAPPIRIGNPVDATVVRKTLLPIRYVRFSFSNRLLRRNCLTSRGPQNRARRRTQHNKRRRSFRASSREGDVCGSLLVLRSSLSERWLRPVRIGWRGKEESRLQRRQLRQTSQNRACQQRGRRPHRRRRWHKLHPQYLPTGGRTLLPDCGLSGSRPRRSTPSPRPSNLPRLHSKPSPLSDRYGFVKRPSLQSWETSEMRRSLTVSLSVLWPVG